MTRRLRGTVSRFALSLAVGCVPSPDDTPQDDNVVDGSPNTSDASTDVGDVAPDAADSAGGDGDAGDCASVVSEHEAVTDWGGFVVSYVSSPDPIVVGPFTLTVRVDSVSGQLPVPLAIDVTGRMPAHGHGIPTTPVVTALGSGTFEVSNLQISMSGGWELQVGVSGAGSREVAVFDLDVD